MRCVKQEQVQVKRTPWKRHCSSPSETGWRPGPGQPHPRREVFGHTAHKHPYTSSLFHAMQARRVKSLHGSRSYSSPGSIIQCFFSAGFLLEKHECPGCHGLPPSPTCSTRCPELTGVCLLDPDFALHGAHTGFPEDVHGQDACQQGSEGSRPECDSQLCHSFTSCVTLDKCLCVSVPQFPHL